MSRALLIAVVLLCGAGADAVEPIHRFHLLRPQLVAKLGARTQAALRGVATLRSATGFVVHEDGRGKALLLTNEHVTRGGVPVGDPITFFDGSVGRVARVLTSHPGLDYSLVEIDLPAGAGRSLPVEPGGLRPGRDIYAIAGYANLRFRDMADAVGGGRAAHRSIQLAGSNHFAIAQGKVDAKAKAASSIAVAGGVQITGKLADLPNSPGMSGSPILARDTHAVVALHSSGNARPTEWQETSVPLGLILQDLDVRSRSGVFDASGHALVRGFLGP